MSKNFLKETIEAIKGGVSSVADVQWVGSADGQFACTWERFVKLADFEYDNSYGAAIIATDLIVAGSDWWLERHEYDGSEWWEHKSTPSKPEDAQPIKLISVLPVKRVGWMTLAELHEAAKAAVE